MGFFFKKKKSALGQVPGGFISRKNQGPRSLNLKTALTSLQGGSMKHFKLIISLILTGITVLFVIQNVSVVEIKFLFWSIAMSRALLIFFVLAAGIVIGWMMHGFFSMHRSPAADETP